MGYTIKVYWKNRLEADFDPDELGGIVAIGFNGPWFVANVERATKTELKTGTILISCSNVERIDLPEELMINIGGPLPGGIELVGPLREF